jgi:hypothetical protein
VPRKRGEKERKEDQERNPLRKTFILQKLKRSQWKRERRFPTESRECSRRVMLPKALQGSLEMRITINVRDNRTEETSLDLTWSLPRDNSLCLAYFPQH